MSKIPILGLILFSFSTSNAQVRTLDLLFVGDVMGHGGQIKAAEIEPNESYDYFPCFEFVSHIISEADLAVANLEVQMRWQKAYT